MIGATLVTGYFDAIMLSAGLCGFFDGDSSNDLMMSDGSIYAGAGSEERGQPKPFSEDWRLVFTVDGAWILFLCQI